MLVPAFKAFTIAATDVLATILERFPPLKRCALVEASGFLVSCHTPFGLESKKDLALAHKGVCDPTKLQTSSPVPNKATPVERVTLVGARTKVAVTCGGGVDRGGLLGSVLLKWFAKDFGAAIADPLAAKIATAEHALSNAGVDFPPRRFIVSPLDLVRWL
jgi:hypothetical protein